MKVKKEVEFTDHQRLWLDRIKACEASGQTLTQFAAANGYSVRTMYDVKKALVKKGVLPGKRRVRFQRVRVAAPPASPTLWQIALPNGATVAFSGKVDASSLSQVLSAASRLR